MSEPFQLKPDARFTNPAQRTRAMTEGWVGDNVPCPGCGSRLHRFANNAPVADFRCDACGEEYELKSSASKQGMTFRGGAYAAMITRLREENNPNLIILRYDKRSLMVRELFVVPRRFFTPAVVFARNPLGPNARRAGWIGCIIRLGELPAQGMIMMLRCGEWLAESAVRGAWRSTQFLAGRGVAERSWLVATLRCLDRLGPEAFRLEQVYAFEQDLEALFPNNRNIRAKLRQQLQKLRDAGQLRFLGGGAYQRVRG